MFKRTISKAAVTAAVTAISMSLAGNAAYAAESGGETLADISVAFDDAYGDAGDFLSDIPQETDGNTDEVPEAADDVQYAADDQAGYGTGTDVTDIADGAAEITDASDAAQMTDGTETIDITATEEDAEDVADAADPQSEAQPSVFHANGGIFSDGTEADVLTADAWKEEDGEFTNTSEVEAGGMPADLFETPEGCTLRYVMLDVVSQTGGGETAVLTDASGKVLLDTGETPDQLSVWKGLFRETPKIQVTGSETPDSAYGYEVKWHAVFSASGDGVYEEPSRDGYLFSGWFADTEGTMVWDGAAGMTVYARWTENTAENMDLEGGHEESAADEYTGAEGQDSTAEPITAAADGYEVIDVDADEDDEPDAGPSAAAPDTDYDEPDTDMDTDEGSAASGASAYTVKHMLMDTDGVNYTLKDTEHLTGSPGTQVSPTTKTYEGFVAPNIQTATIAQDGSTEIEYRYARKSFNYTLTQVEGADLNGSTPSGSRYYGEEITLKCTPSAGYEFVQWSNGDQAAVTSFSMPAEDVTITPSVQTATYTITYDLDGGEASNPESYTMQTEAFTLNAPKKEGSTFVGWTGANGDTPQVTVTVNKGTSGDLSFKANWSGGANTNGIAPTSAPEQPGGLTNVKTGDEMRPILYAGIAAAALAVVVLVLILGRKKRR